MKLDELTIAQLYELQEIVTGGRADERREEARNAGLGQWTYVDPERHRPIELGDDDDLPTEELFIELPFAQPKRRQA